MLDKVIPVHPILTFVTKGLFLEKIKMTLINKKILCLLGA